MQALYGCLNQPMHHCARLAHFIIDCIWSGLRFFICSAAAAIIFGSKSGMSIPAAAAACLSMAGSMFFIDSAIA